MSTLAAILVAYLLLSLGITLFYLRTVPNGLFRLVALVYLGASIGSSLYLYNQLLSLPRPIEQEYFNRQAKEAVVLAVRARDDHSIYLWLELPGQDAPRYYSMPWNGKAAEELQMAKKEVAEQGGLLLMKGPFQLNQNMGQRGDEKDRVFYASPPPRPPPKAGEAVDANAAYKYQHH